MKQPLYSFFPLKKEPLSIVRCSWNDDSCRNGDSSGCFDLSGGFGDDLAVIAFVRGKFTEGVDLTLKEIEKT